ncbi:hypothetical protein B0J13DRAFT_531785 [Dactylonectria estremocensis]|uniref:Uncharacterized protein n=1 Tax=Dactylonectria estremocensis TaxID=1079267 RepID=A0A9P9DK21_9HYPO|nr:hypothetical protein B0J13DRAFT_531785 [Dactylonectria estremocensis]
MPPATPGLGNLSMVLVCAAPEILKESEPEIASIRILSQSFSAVNPIKKQTWKPCTEEMANLATISYKLSLSPGVQRCIKKRMQRRELVTAMQLVALLKNAEFVGGLLEIEVHYLTRTKD